MRINRKLKMKKTLLLLSLVALITSCVNNGIRFVKQPRQQVVKVDRNESLLIEIAEAPVILERALIPNDCQEDIFENIILIRTDSQKEIIGKELEDQILSYSNLSASVYPDSVLIELEKDIKVTEYEKTELDAKKAKNLMLASLLSLIGIFVFGLGLLASIILFIIGNKYLNRVNKSLYNTKEGKDFLRKAKIMRVIWISICSAFLALILLVYGAFAGFY